MAFGVNSSFDSSPNWEFTRSAFGVAAWDRLGRWDRRWSLKKFSEVPQTAQNLRHLPWRGPMYPTTLGREDLKLGAPVGIVKRRLANGAILLPTFQWATLCDTNNTPRKVIKVTGMPNFLHVNFGLTRHVCQTNALSSCAIPPPSWRLGTGNPENPKLEHFAQLASKGGQVDAWEDWEGSQQQYLFALSRCFAQSTEGVTRVIHSPFTNFFVGGFLY